MRLFPLLPVVCSVVALILTFLCLFAGHKQGFMEDYQILNLNTSALGQTLLPEDLSSSNPLLDLIYEIPNTISELINDQIGEIRERVGIEDFYSAHILSHCQGQYTPVEAANATVSEGDISKNVTECSEAKAMSRFDPTQLIQDALDSNAPVAGVTLDALGWPDDIEDNIERLNAFLAAVFVFYILAIILIFIALLAALYAVFVSGRLTMWINLIAASVAFLTIALASGLVTGIQIQGTDIINGFGNDIGVFATGGGKFLALTWSAAGLMFVAQLVWIVEFCVARREKKRAANPAKDG